MKFGTNMPTTDAVCGPLNCGAAGIMRGLKDAGASRKLPKAVGILASARFLFSLLVKTWYRMTCVNMPWRSKSLALPAVSQFASCRQEGQTPTPHILRQHLLPSLARPSYRPFPLYTATVAAAPASTPITTNTTTTTTRYGTGSGPTHNRSTAT